MYIVRYSFTLAFFSFLFFCYLLEKMKKYTSAVQSTKKDFDQNSAYLCTGSKQSEYFYCMHIIIVEMLLVVIELPQLPLLLLLKLHVHRKVCAGAAAAAELFIIVCRMTHFVAVDYCT